MGLAFLALVGVLALVFGPSWWVRRTLRRYAEPADRYPGTGADFARHLLDRLGLERVRVELTELGDHYDPEAKAVRLRPEHHQRRSLAAITVAAHEVGHAIQDADGYAPLRFRTRLAAVALHAQRFSLALLLAAPLLGLVLRSRVLAVLLLALSLLGVFLATVLHLVTLPVEWDASFRRALPVLQRGGYLLPGDERHARRILWAAAVTYVAGSLVQLLVLLRLLRP